MLLILHSKKKSFATSAKYFWFKMPWIVNHHLQRQQFKWTLTISQPSQTWTHWVAMVNQTTFSTSLSVSYNVTRIFWFYRLRHLQHSTTTHTYTHSPSKWIRHSLSDAVNILNFSASRGVCIFLWGKWRPLGQGLIPVCALNLGPVSGSKPIPGVSKLFSKWARFDEVNIGEGQGHFLNH